MLFYGFFNLLPLACVSWTFKAYVTEYVTVRRYMKRAYRRIIYFFYPFLLALIIIMTAIFFKNESILKVGTCEVTGPFLTF